MVKPNPKWVNGTKRAKVPKAGFPINARTATDPQAPAAFTGLLSRQRNDLVIRDPRYLESHRLCLLMKTETCARA